MSPENALARFNGKVMMEFYRFRTTQKLLDTGFQELERQTIFFAGPEELNDPMEGFQDTVWDGDHIVWSNLLKNYVHCLSWTCIDSLANRRATSPKSQGQHLTRAPNKE